MNQKIALNEATEVQLRAFAETHLGMTFPQNAKEETIRAKISTAWNKDEIVIEVADEPPAVDGAPPRPATAAQQPPVAGKVRILIQRTEEKFGDEPVPVSVNGRAMLVPRGREVDIPFAYYEVLKNAVRLVYEMDEDGKNMKPEPREVLAYPFQRVA